MSPLHETLPRMTYVDLRPDDVRPVEVLVEGSWLAGELEAYRRDRETWRGWVRWSTGIGENRLDWFDQRQLRRGAS